MKIYLGDLVTINGFNQTLFTVIRRELNSAGEPVFDLINISYNEYPVPPQTPVVTELRAVSQSAIKSCKSESTMYQ